MAELRSPQRELGDFMSCDEIVNTLNRQGHPFSFHQIPRDGVPAEVADTFGYFEGTRIRVRIRRIELRSRTEEPAGNR
jgi:hypothetical protein